MIIHVQKPKEKGKLTLARNIYNYLRWNRISLPYVLFFWIVRIINVITVSRRSSNANRRVVSITISVLYLFGFVNFILQWYILDWDVVRNGDTRDSVYWASIEGQSWFSLVGAFLPDSSLLISDGLLVGLHYRVLNITH